MREPKTVMLRIDRSTALPLMYEYDDDEGCYRTFGFVRLGSIMVPEFRHHGPEGPATRNEFLTALLMSLLIPERRARKIVRRALASERSRESSIEEERWRLTRVHGLHDWALANVSGKPAYHLYVEFSGVFDGRPWTEGVAPTKSRIEASETLHFNIAESASVNKVVVEWKPRKSRLSRVRRRVFDI